jgi:hypothetical protein
LCVANANGAFAIVVPTFYLVTCAL